MAQNHTGGLIRGQLVNYVVGNEKRVMAWSCISSVNNENKVNLGYKEIFLGDWDRDLFGKNWNICPLTSLLILELKYHNLLQKNNILM